MQVLPSTAKWLDVPNYMEIEGNVHAGAKYMDKLMDRYAKTRKSAKRTEFFWPWPHTMQARVVLGNTESAH